MKPVRKNQRRQARRERTLARLEKFLEGGVKQVVDRVEEVGGKFGKAKGLVKFYKTVPFELKDRQRIQGEILTLRTRLSIVQSQNTLA